MGMSEREKQLNTLLTIMSTPLNNSEGVASVSCLVIEYRQFLVKLIVIREW